jgi:transposase
MKKKIPRRRIDVNVAELDRIIDGAEVGDVFMSLIHTCQLCGANSFEYLTELQRHARELAVHPAEWMPWNYRERLAHAPPSEYS